MVPILFKPKELRNPIKLRCSKHHQNPICGRSRPFNNPRIIRAKSLIIKYFLQVISQSVIRHAQHLRGCAQIFTPHKRQVTQFGE